MTSNEISRILFEHEAWLNGSGRCANLRGADLRGADLRGADLSDANLHRANLHRANLHRADLRGADLRGADLRDANLCDADLSGANLSGANLSGANLTDVGFNVYTSMFCMVCPEKGAFIGYKKAANYIVELLILDDARRSSATSRKCRCDKAKVLSITTLEGRNAGVDSVFSDWDNTFAYTVGTVVEEPRFCTDRWVECASGIHFFITREEAVNYE